jgi:hypothetical protein
MVRLQCRQPAADQRSGRSSAVKAVERETPWGKQVFRAGISFQKDDQPNPPVCWRRLVRKRNRQRLVSHRRQLKSKPSINYISP